MLTDWSMLRSDGLFLEEARKAASAAGLRYEEALVDSLCAGLVLQPQAYDVLVAPNCWGDIVSDLAGGVVGSLVEDAEHILSLRKNAAAALVAIGAAVGLAAAWIALRVVGAKERGEAKKKA